MTYDVEAGVGGKLTQLGGRPIASTAKNLAADPRIVESYLGLGRPA